MKEYILNIEGMMCEGCVKRIDNVLKEFKGIKKYQISLEKHNVVLEFKDSEILKDVINKINDLGFKVLN